jgi:hypothetical protein
MKMENFTPIFNGIKEHVEAGQFSGFELGIYLFLQLWKRWDCGVIWTTAASIKGTFKHKEVKLRSVQNALNRLRTKEYIDYKPGDGSGWVYPVLIVKALCTDGVLKGCRTLGFYDAEKEYVVYDTTDGDYADTVRTLCASLYGSRMNEVRSRWGASAVLVHLLDLKTGRLTKLARIEDLNTPPRDPEEKSEDLRATGKGA